MGVRVFLASQNRCASDEPAAANPASDVTSCELNHDQPHDKSHGDQKRQSAHPLRRAAVRFGAPRLPVPPSELSFGVRHDGGLKRHRRAS